MLAIAAIIDYPSDWLMFSKITGNDESGLSATYALKICALWLLFKPTSMFRFSLFLCAIIATLFILLPRVPNHLVFVFVVACSIIAAWAGLVIRDKTLNINPSTLYNTFSPIIRVEVLLLYFWAVTHKFNSGFFNSSTSCSTLHIFKLKDQMHFIPTFEALITVNIYLTIFIEILIPLFLIFRQTRMIGLLLGLLFHLVVSFSYPGFTTAIYATLSLFLTNHLYYTPRNQTDKHGPSMSDTRPPLPNTIYYSLQICALLAILALLSHMYSRQWNYLRISINQMLVAAYALVIILYFIWIILPRWRTMNSDVPIFRTTSHYLWVFPAILFLNGLTPYLGIKNTQAFAMFSNLSTERGKTNHLFIPPSIQLSNNLSDLVQINESSDSVINAFGKTIREHPWTSTYIPLSSPYFGSKYGVQSGWRFDLPYFMLRSRITELRKNGVKGIYVNYIRDGRTFVTSNAERDPHLSTAPYLARKFLLMRAVPREVTGLCMW